MKRNILPLCLMAVSSIFYMACNNQKAVDDYNKGQGTNEKSTGLNCENGYDTSRYTAVYNKGGNLILVAKNNASFKSAEHIKPSTAIEMIAAHLKPFVTESGELQDEVSRYVDFDIERLMGFFTESENAGRRPTSLRIYFGQYNADNAPKPGYKGRMTTILVGVQDGKDIFNVAEERLWPVNIGTLCPPDCISNDDINDDNNGAIFAKKGARDAGGRNW